MRTLDYLLAIGLTASVASPDASAADSRLREVRYDAGAVVTVPVARGLVTHILLDADEQIADVAVGLGSDCAKPESSWCVAAQPGGRSLFIKPKSNASSPNNIAVVTDRRSHAFKLEVVPQGSAQALYRLIVKAPLPPIRVAAAVALPPAPSASIPPSPSPESLVQERLLALPRVVNTNYSIAEGPAASDIVPTLVFDDGRFTYFRFPGNGELPAAFDVLGDGSETLLNARMEGDLLVVDRVSRRLMLRAGEAVVGVWNEAFDLDGRPAEGATTVDGVRRHLRAHSDRAGSYE